MNVGLKDLMQYEQTDDYLSFIFPSVLIGRKFHLYADDNYVFSHHVQDYRLNIRKDSSMYTLRIKGTSQITFIFCETKSEAEKILNEHKGKN
jgi:hypothetical protein